MPSDEFCPARDDEQHCNCWYDGGACCSCDASAMTEQQKVEQGMVEGPVPDARG